MPKTNPFRDFVLEQLDGWGEVRARAMFGGVGLYQGPTFFGLISSDGHLYLKVDDYSRTAYAARGMGPFRPSSGAVMARYYEVPPDILEDRAALREWAMVAVGVAHSG